VLSFLANNLQSNDFKNMRETFNLIDKEKTGKLSLEQLMRAFDESGMEKVKDKVSDIMNKMDYRKEGKINYTEFLAASINSHEVTKKSNLQFAFHYFDTDGTGFITSENLQEVFQREGRSIDIDEINKMLTDADLSKTGKISWEDFYKLMKHIENNVDVDLDKPLP
jgi:Ca2+-binding EF-hand superfamily protein